MFPGSHATVYYNEAGEPLGWDNEYYFDEPEYHDCCGVTGRCRCDEDDYDFDRVGSGNDDL